MAFNWKFATLVGVVSIAIPVIGCASRIEPTKLNSDVPTVSEVETSDNEKLPESPETREAQDTETIPVSVDRATSERILREVRRTQSYQQRLSQVCQALNSKFKWGRYTFKQQGDFCKASPKNKNTVNYSSKSIPS